MTKTISDLPKDLLMEIVRRVPLTSMRAVRLTCKKWDDLSKNGIFRKMHMCKEAAREKGESRFVLIMGFNLHLISAVVDDVEHPSTKSIGKLSCSSLDDSYQRIIEVHHCDGLLLCVLKDTFELVVWNPYLGQTRWIEPPSYSYRDPYGMDTYRYAFGYDNNKKHKILRFIKCSRPTGKDFFCYEIYDLESHLWKTIDVVTPRGYFYIYPTGVPLNGNTYWLAKSRTRNDDAYDMLIYFDFTSEKFEFPKAPFPCEEDRNPSKLLSCLKGEKLSLLLQLESLELEIWVTDANNMSWSKFFKVEFDTEPAWFLHSGFFIDEEKKVAVVFDKGSDTHHTLNIIGEAGLISEVDLAHLVEERDPGSCYDFHAHVCSYVPSLVQVQKK